MSDMEQMNMTHAQIVWTDLDSEKSLDQIAEGTIDRILIANILFQLEHPGRIFSECHRVLKKGGLLLCIDWVESFGHIGPQPQAIVHPDTARQLIIKSGLQILKESLDVGPHHYGFLAQK
jgi:ubiquinone/menaquinone biosynthesis C-methylase UbiE